MFAVVGYVACCLLFASLLMLSHRPWAHFPRALVSVVAFSFSHLAAVASGIYQDGASARSQALGGAATGSSGRAVDALSTNPAGLSSLAHPAVELGLGAGFVHGEFSNRSNQRAQLDDFGLKPYGALVYPVGPITFGAGLIPDSAMRAAWRYRDAPGGLDGGTSYGDRDHRAEIEVLRFALGASYAIAPTFSFGASVGVLYNRNLLVAPYTIQTQPQLRSAKVLLEMETEGWGVNAQFGTLWKPVPTLQIGLSYTLASRVVGNGSARADAGRQLSNLGVTGVDATADFNAEVTNTFPQIVSAGVTWEATRKLMFVGQVDWINWADSFDTLEVRLGDVDNDVYRALLAGNRDLDDDVPLNWRDQWVFRFGGEYALDDRWTVRAGYRYARNPVPETTLTPLTAVIGEHVVSAGLGYRAERYSIDLGWQWQLPADEHVARSGLLNGEYSESDVKVSVHWLTLGTRVEF